MKRLRGQAGLTLVELMIVVAIIGILAGIGIPSFRRIMPRVRLTNNASLIANEIASVRMQAIAKSMEFRVVFNPATESYTLQKAVGAGWAAPYSTVFLSGTDMTSVAGFSPTADTLIVRSNGVVSVPLGAQAAIVLETPFNPPATEGDLQKQILVQTTGRVIIQKRMTGGSWVTE